MSNRYIGAVVTETVNVAQSPYTGAWTLQAEMQGTAQNNWSSHPTQIANSLRFRSSATAYLSRSMGSGTATKFTFSAWVKRGALSTNETIFNVWTGLSGSSGISLRFLSSDKLVVGFDTYYGGSGFAGELASAAVFRDSSAWYHIVLAADFSAGSFASFQIGRAHV